MGFLTVEQGLVVVFGLLNLRVSALLPMGLGGGVAWDTDTLVGAPGSSEVGAG